MLERTLWSRKALPVFAAALVLLASSIGCRDDQPLTPEDILREQLEVDTLYLTEDGREVIAPGTSEGVIVFPGTSDLAWPAMTCENPDCPGEGEGDRPFVFPWPDPFKYVDDDGNIQLRDPESDEDFKLMEQFGEQCCPACLPTRNRSRESIDEQIQYKSWVVPYVLPESAKRLKELEEQKRKILPEK
jgi:hypothetical protein